MPPTCTLGELRRGHFAAVTALNTQGPMRRRLMDIGISPGVRICALFKSCSGDPTAYLVHDTVIALRRDDADTVIVREE